jgi:hypothetical protein
MLFVQLLTATNVQGTYCWRHLINSGRFIIFTVLVSGYESLKSQVLWCNVATTINKYTVHRAMTW